MWMHIYEKGTDLAGVTPVAALSWSAVAGGVDLEPAGGATAGVDPEADLVFALTATAAPEGIPREAVAVPPGPWLLRVDEVCFPVGAVAHRHTHNGSGFRYLVRGSLRIEAEDHNTTMMPGDSWFEPMNTPVRAVALHEEGVTSFVRCMVVPPALEGKSTYALVDPGDAKLPRLQVTHRHIDLPFQVEAG